MAKVVYEQAKVPFWQVPRAPEGIGSFLIGEIKSKAVPIRREKADKSGFYDTTEVTVQTMVAIEGRADMVPVIFKVQDMAIGGVVLQKYPQKPGVNMPSPVGTFIGVFYHDTNAKGYYQPDMYLAESLAEILSDMNGDCLARMHTLQNEGPESEWRFTYSAWTPVLSEYMAKQGVKADDLPF